jgi:preprotein translocase subunit SecG
MSLIIGLLTFVLVLNCLLLILLVLVQLPKKEAGVGMAFGGAATDALFGAGSGNVLTKVTKYATIAFFVLTILVAALQGGTRDTSGKSLEDAIARQASTPPPSSVAAPAVAPISSNMLSTTLESISNAPAASTNGSGN